MTGKFTLKNIIYPGIILVIVALTIFCMVRTIAFISETINNIFVTDQNTTDQMIKVDMKNYLLVAKKLGLPTSQ